MDVLYAKGWSFNLIGSAPSPEEKAPETGQGTLRRWPPGYRHHESPHRL